MFRLAALSLLLVAPSALAKKPKKNQDLPPAELAPPAPTGPPMVEVPCPYQAGSAHQFQVTRIVEPRSTTIALDVQVVSATPEGAVLELKYGVGKLQGADPVEAAVNQVLAAKWAETPIRLALVHEGHQVTIENLQEQVSLFRQALDEVAANPELPAERVQAFRDTLEQPEKAEQFLRRDIEPVLAHTCGSFPLEPTELPGQGTFVATRFDYSTMAFDVTDASGTLHIEVSLKDGWPIRLEQVGAAGETVRIMKSR